MVAGTWKRRLIVGCCWALFLFAALVNPRDSRNLWAQASASENGTESRVVLATLHAPIYPRLAAAAAIHGDVELSLLIGQNGSVESVNVATGHPMLRQAAIDSARDSRFECRECGKSGAPYSLIYQFRITATDPQQYCNHTTGDTPAPKLDESGHHVTVLAEEMWTCDPAVSYRKVRSTKCLYLWKCGVR
jgi:TonB family protein